MAVTQPARRPVKGERSRGGQGRLVQVIFGAEDIVLPPPRE